MLVIIATCTYMCSPNYYIGSKVSAFKGDHAPGQASAFNAFNCVSTTAWGYMCMCIV